MRSEGFAAGTRLPTLAPCRYLPEADLQRRLAVAEDVIRGAHARRDVVVAGDAVGAREAGAGEKGARRLCDRREPAPRMIVAQRALQREPIERPLILREEGHHRRARVVEVGIRVLGDRDRHAAREGVQKVLRIHVQLAVVAPPVALVPELHAVRPGDIRGVEEPVGPVGLVDQPVLRAVIHQPDGALRVDHRLVLRHPNQVPRRIRIELAVAPLVVGVAEAGFEEQPVRDRRRPARGLHALWTELAVTVRFRSRQSRRRRAAERCRAAARPAHGLFIPRERELVPLRGLPRDARRVVLPLAVVEGRLAEIRSVGPLRRVARVGVVVDVQDVAARPLLADAHVVPELVPQDRAADRRVEVVDVVGRIRCPRTPRLQIGGIVVRLHAFREAGPRDQAAHPVAALPRHDVHLHARGFEFTEAARRHHRHFHRIADVGRIVRWLVATRRIADVQAVNREARLDAAAAVHGKDREHRTGVDVGDVRLQARDGGEQIAVAADAWKAPHRLVVERDGAPRALHVDHRRFTGDGDGLCDGADPHLCVDLDNAGTRDDDVVALQGGEPRERERHGVRARLQALDPVLPGGIGRRRPGFFNQHRARRFDGDAGQHGARRVFDGAGEGHLCQRSSRRDTHRDEENATPQDSSHGRASHVFGPRRRRLPPNADYLIQENVRISA